MDGKRLDEIQQIEEKAKLPYQNMLKPFVGALFAIILFVILERLF